jgi:TolA-binding protein
MSGRGAKGAMELDIQALELLIKRDGEKSGQIAELQRANESLIRLVTNLSARIEELIQRVDGLETLSSQSANHIQLIKDKQELLALDAGADHHLATDRDGVVQDWQREHAAGLNTDMIPYAEQEILEGMEHLHVRRRGRNQ